MSDFERAKQYFLDGLFFLDQGDFLSAEQSFENSLAIIPDRVSTLTNLSVTQLKLKKYSEAKIAAKHAINLDKDNSEAYLNLGLIEKEVMNFSLALEYFDRALALNFEYAEAWSNKGAVFNHLRRYQDAITCYDKAISLKPDYAEAWSNKGAVLNHLKRYQDAVSHLDKSISLKPDYAEAWSNKGVSLYELERYQEAIFHYDKAISLKSGYAEAWSNKSIVLSELKRYEEVIACCEKSLSLKQDYAEAWVNKGSALHELKKLDEAITCYEKALSLKPDLEWILGDLMYLKLKVCSWDDCGATLALLPEKIKSGEKIITPFPLLSLIDDPLLHQQCAQIFTQEKYPVNLALGPIAKRAKSSKIRLGYFSADFGNHPVSLLTAELFELHDRNQFEVIAFSFGPDDQSTMRSRLQNTFDQFIDVTELSDQAVASLARDHKIDIAVDLGGHTKGARTGIFAYRAAPIQIGYIGYLGTMGDLLMDYVLSDQTIIQQESMQFFSEKIAYLPSYQVNDRKRVVSAKQFSRQELGLPEKGFVFSCFNNNFKILPDVFDSWMRILHAVENSVLFLYAENQWVQTNLVRQAEARGVNGQRLVFGSQLPVEEYLARYRSCDLFLDTAPYNAGTTASDALWAGLPVLTLPGQSFASRVAASLLNAIELPELIASSRDHYEALAIELASNPSKLAAIKEKLVNNRQTTPLFNTPLFTQNLEKAYTQIYERYQADLPPDHVVVG